MQQHVQNVFVIYFDQRVDVRTPLKKKLFTLNVYKHTSFCGQTTWQVNANDVW